MKQTKVISFIVVLLVFSTHYLNAQDVHFSQFGQTPQLINPGATGVYNGNVRAFLNYKNQWGNIGNGYKTYAASFDAPILKGKGRTRGRKAYLGIGVNFYRDVAGSSKYGSTQAGLSVSGILPLTRMHTLSVGIQTAYGQNSASLNQLTWGSQYDGDKFDTQNSSLEQISSKSSHYFDLGTGIYYQFKNHNSSFLGSDVSSFNIGIAGYHLTKPKQTFLNRENDNLPIKIIAQFSGTFKLGDYPLAIVPSFFYAVQGTANEFTPGILLKIKKGHETKYSGQFKEAALYVGAHYRAKDAFIPQIYFEFLEYMFGISYDVSNSALSAASGASGGLEFSFRYTYKTKALQRAGFK